MRRRDRAPTTSPASSTAPTPTLLATDPPYGVSLDGSWRDGVYNALGPAERTYMRTDGQADGDDATRAPGGAPWANPGHRNTTLSGDTRVDWCEAFALVPSLTVGYVWHAGVHAAEVAAGLERIGFEIVTQVIWDKGLFAIGPLLVPLEPRALLGRPQDGRQGALPGLARPGHDLAGPQPQDDHGRLRRGEAGPPDPEAARPLRDPDPQPPAGRARPLYDPFFGSGTALIAAERTGARCYAMEIDPVYVEVALAPLGALQRAGGGAGRWLSDQAPRPERRRSGRAGRTGPRHGRSRSLVLRNRRRDPCAERVAIELDRRRTPAERDRHRARARPTRSPASSTPCSTASA